MLVEHVRHLLLVRVDGGVDPPDGTLGVRAHALARHARVAALLLEEMEKKKREVRPRMKKKLPALERAASAPLEAFWKAGDLRVV